MPSSFNKSKTTFVEIKIPALFTPSTLAVAATYVAAVVVKALPNALSSTSVNFPPRTFLPSTNANLLLNVDLELIAHPLPPLVISTSVPSLNPLWIASFSAAKILDLS